MAVGQDQGNHFGVGELGIGIYHGRLSGLLLLTHGHMILKSFWSDVLAGSENLGPRGSPVGD